MSADSIALTMLEALTNNEEYARKCLPHLKADYFQRTSEKEIFEVVNEYYAKYNSIPSVDIIKVELSSRELLEKVYDDCLDDLSRFSIIQKNTDWLFEVSEKYCKERALYNAIRESVFIMEGKDGKKSVNAIPSILEDALAVTFNNSIGHDYFLDAEKRFDLYLNKENKIPFDIEILNKITSGGYSFKTLNLVAAGTGVGKTIFGCHYAACALKQGHDVLYITLEMADTKIAERIDANLLNIELNSIQFLQKENFLNRINEIKKKTTGNLIMYEYPTGEGHVGHFKALLADLKHKKNIVPKLIVVDYLNICASQKYVGSSENSNAKVKAVAEELRALAVTQNCIILTFTQFNRSGMQASDHELTDTSESIGVTYTVDSYLALNEPEELAMMQQIMAKQLKNRYTDKNKNTRFILGLDKSRMTFYDVEESAQTLINESDLYEEDSSTKSLSKSNFTNKKDSMKKTGKFNKIKYD